MSNQILYLERPSFWTEDRDPECWCRGLKALARLENEKGVIRGTPRSLWQRRLNQVLSRRSILGLFGLKPETRNPKPVEVRFLLGVGFLEHHPNKRGWKLAAFSKPLIAEALEDREALEQLGIAILKRSPWVRLMVFRLIQGDWALSGWRKLRDGRGKLKAGSSLILHRFSEENDWFSGIESLCANEWLSDGMPAAAIRLHPDVLSRDSRRDDFSWAPFKAPLYLFDYLGWLVDDGNLRIPHDVLKAASMATGEKGQTNASAFFREITQKEADLRGFVPVEKALRKLHGKIHPNQNPSAEEFAVWMDALMSCAIEKGAIEILAAEPGQARHGRGLFGDRQRKLARWVVHEDFSDCLAKLERKISENKHVGHLDSGLHRNDGKSASKT